MSARRRVIVAILSCSWPTSSVVTPDVREAESSFAFTFALPPMTGGTVGGKPAAAAAAVAAMEAAAAAAAA